MSNRLGRVAALAALLAAVAVAFADSSIVVLALPDLLREYDASITGVAWVITSYNLALAVVAIALVPLLRRLDPVKLARAGFALFLAASIACGASPGLWALVTFRTVQGVGGALLLAGALSLARGLSARGAGAWAAAGIVGAGIGPAGGGLLTQLLDWRAIFFAQAPVAALGLVVALVRTSAPREEPAREGRARRLAANASLALVSGALVGLLFLAVVMLVDVWRLEPLAAAAVVSAVPLATLAAQSFARAASAPGAGVLLLAGGLCGMALLPAHSIAWAAVALAVAGFGFGLLAPALTSLAGGTISIGSRHVGLVAGLLLLTPLLTSDLLEAAERTKLQATATVLDARLPVSQKLDLAFALVPVLERPARKELPDFEREVERLQREKGLSPEAAEVGRSLDTVVVASVTRAFRNSYLVAALLALLALLPTTLALRRKWDLRAPALAAAVAVALVGAELTRGALHYGDRPHVPPPCAKRHAFEGNGVDATSQRLVMKALDAIACRLDKSREQLVIDLAKRGVDAADLVRKLEDYARRLRWPIDWLRRIFP